MIGIFDSGLGGLTVVRRVRERLPSEDLVFFADQAHVPYGGRGNDELFGLLRHNLAWLDAQSIDALVMGCNTSCAIAEIYGWPVTRAALFDLIDSAAVAVERGGFKRVGVIATEATVRSGAYGRRLRARTAGIEVAEVAAPALVPLVEAGKLAGEETVRAVRAVCDALPRDIDAAILACTHYPLLDATFARVLGDVSRVDPAVLQAERSATHLHEASPGRAAESGTIRYVTNGNVEHFRASVARIMNDANPVCESIVPVS